MDTDYADFPNSWALRAADFDYDPDSYLKAIGFLGDVSVGAPEERALSNEAATAEMLRSWEQSHRFRRALDKARRMGDAERRYDERRAQPQADPFATPPRRGAPDIALEQYNPAEPPPDGLRGWLKRLAARARIEIEQAPPPAPSAVRFIPLADLTPADMAVIAQQNAEAQARQLAQGDGVYEQQTWNGKGLSPDGAQWGR